MAVQQLGKIDALVRTANQEWFGTDLEANEGLGQGEKWTMHLSINTTTLVQYTLDSGSTWISFNSGADLVANAGYEFTFIVDGADTINFRALLAVTVNHCRVYIS